MSKSSRSSSVGAHYVCFAGVVILLMPMIENSKPETIKIKAHAKKNGLTLSLVGFLLLLIAIVVLSQIESINPIASYFVIASCAVLMLIGLFKLREPEHSLILDEQGLSFFHVKGQWTLAWQNIQRCDVLVTTRGVEACSLPYVGISVRHYPALLDNISLRLASHLLNEQRNLLVLALKEEFAKGECPDGSCPTEALFDIKDVVHEGKTYKGLIGMFANRLNLLRSKLGYDLYLPVSALDRDADAFVRLIRVMQANYANSKS